MDNSRSAVSTRSRTMALLQGEPSEQDDNGDLSRSPWSPMLPSAAAAATPREGAQAPSKGNAGRRTQIAALRRVSLFQPLGDSAIAEAAAHVEKISLNRGDYVLRPGDGGGDVFVVEHGECVEEVDGRVVATYGGPSYFGPRARRRDGSAVSVRVTSETLLCFRVRRQVVGPVLRERAKAVFQLMVGLTHERNTAVQKVRFFKALHQRGRSTAAASLKLVAFERGDYVMRQGDEKGDFYMIRSGECVAEVNGAVVSRYLNGGHFGERAVSSNRPQAAGIRVTSNALVCFRMPRPTFQSLMKEKRPSRMSANSRFRASVDHTQERIERLREVKLFRTLNSREVSIAARAIDVVFYERGEYVVRQGEQGSEFFMVDYGVCVVEVDGRVVSTYTKGGYFGERALLSDVPRAASIKAISDTLACFRISQSVFKSLMNARITALREVKLFKSLNYREIEEAAEALEVVEYKEEDYVMRQHEQGNEFFMVDLGECVVEVDGKVVRKYCDGGSFGERALMNDEPRSASVKVTSEKLVCFRMSQDVFKKIMSVRINVLQQVKLLQSLGRSELAEAAEALDLVLFKQGEYVMRQGEKTREFFIVDRGQCVVEVDGAVVFQYSDEGSFGERALLREEPRAASIRVSSDTLSCFRISHQDFKAIISDWNNKERLIKNCPMFETMSDDQVTILAGAFRRQRHPIFLDAPPIIKQGMLTNENSCFYLLEKGECVATILQPDGSQQEVKSYRTGDVFGEKALIESKPRAATIVPKKMKCEWMDTALPGAAILKGELPPERIRDFKNEGQVEVVLLQLSRAEFEKQLGSPMSQLQAAQYNSDPRKLLADFYRKGDLNGPMGSVLSRKADKLETLAEEEGSAEVPLAGSSSWFAVYRPCSTESIAKMIGKVGVGKGLNVKGKSAKMNRLSGFVPFVQISNNAHKEKVEAPSTSPAFDIHIYFRSAANREEAKIALEKCLDQMVLPKGEAASPSPIRFLTRYEESSSEPSFGLAVPEFLFMEFYIMKPDLSPVLGWETGRPSQPAFQNMNLHSVRMEKDGTPPSDPPACIYQFDKGDPLNSSGLLIAYAEELHVKPVVSDFDTFLVGSQGAKPFDHLEDEQRALMMWLLNKTEHVLLDKESGIRDEKFNWTSTWLDKVLSKEAMEKDTFEIPIMPKFGFGDPTSYHLIEDVVDRLSECGAVRHGAECFNYVLPQELDEEFLVIWDGFESLTGKPWETLNEKKLIEFFVDRVHENFVFPLNPVWMVRDGNNGWSKLFELMLSNNHIKERIKCWYTEEAIAKIRDLSQKISELSEEQELLRRSRTTLLLSQVVDHNGSLNNISPELTTSLLAPIGEEEEEEEESWLDSLMSEIDEDASNEDSRDLLMATSVAQAAASQTVQPCGAITFPNKSPKRILPRHSRPEISLLRSTYDPVWGGTILDELLSDEDESTARQNDFGEEEEQDDEQDEEQQQQQQQEEEEEEEEEGSQGILSLDEDASNEDSRDLPITTSVAQAAASQTAQPLTFPNKSPEQIRTRYSRPEVSLLRSTYDAVWGGTSVDKLLSDEDESAVSQDDSNA